jgi:hypothetical protein
MNNKSPRLDNWQFEIHEVSACVYVVDARHASGATFHLEGTDNDGGESFLSAYSIAVEKSIDKNTLHNLVNWSVSILERSAGVYMVDATHQLGPKISFGASSTDDVVFQLHAYAGELEKAIESKRRHE